MTEHDNSAGIDVDTAWRRAKIAGWIFLILGALAILAPTVATIAVELLVAWFLIFSGASGIYLWSQLNGEEDRWRLGLVAALTLLLGLVFLIAPMAGARTLTLLLAVIFLLEGIATVSVGMKVRERLKHWGWLVFSGASSVVLALLIFVGWPGTATWVIGLLFGINLLTTGLSLVMMAGSRGV